MNDALEQKTAIIIFHFPKRIFPTIILESNRPYERTLYERYSKKLGEDKKYILNRLFPQCHPE